MSDSSVLHAIAGAGAGCASLALTYPLYSRMVRQQVQSQVKPDTTAQLAVPCSSGCVPSLSDALRSLRHLLTAEGLAPHFHGLSAALYAITIQSGIYYFAFQFFKNLHGVSVSPLGNLLTSSEAGIATVMLTNPLWVLNSRQITRQTTPTTAAAAATLPSSSISASSPPASITSSTSSSSSSPSSPTAASTDISFFTAFRLLVAREGLAGVYSGVGPALALVSSPAIQFASYEYLRALLLRARTATMVAAAAANGGTVGVAYLTSLDFFLLGALSKILATLATYPIQTLKSQLQKDASPYAQMGWISGIWACISDMARSDEGVASFYRGLKAKILQTGLTSAFLFVIRERLIWILTKLVQAQQARKALAP